MNLNDFFHLSVSIFSLVATIFLIVVFVWAVILNNQLNKLIQKLNEVLEVAKTTAGETRDFVERTIKSLEAFKESILTFDFIRKIVTEIIDHIKNKPKGVKHGQTK